MLNDYVIAIILGIVEGLTEFIPVSSTAHLRITEVLLKVPLEDEFWKTFTIVIQLGAILAVVTYFSKTIIKMLRSQKKTQIFNWALPIDPLLFNLIASFVVTAIPAFLLSKVIDKNLESLFVIGSALFVGGVIMIGVDFKFKKGRVENVQNTSTKQAVFIGAVQILSAVFPGVSRSMSTIVGGQLAGLSRAAALEFSFLLSVPVMFAATGYDVLKTMNNPNIHVLKNYNDWLIVFVGGIVSFIVAWAVVAWLMNWVRTKSFVLFGVYRIILGLAVLFMNFKIV